MSDVEIQLTTTLGTFNLEVDITAPGQGITALFGPSGSGKTSVLRCLAGLEQPRAGRIKVNDQVWFDASSGFSLATHQRALGYVFQDARLFPHLTVQGNLDYGRRRIAHDQRRVAFDDAVDLLGLALLLSRKPEHLSGGERQRVAIARALLTSPVLLLMDEPLAALDERSKQEILPYLERLHAELSIPVIYVSHAIREVARLADHLVLIEQGRVMAQGSVHQLLTRPELRGLGEDDRGSVIDAEVTAHDAEYQLSALSFPGGSIWVGAKSLALGHRVRVFIPSADVSISLMRHQHTSILNILEARIDSIVPLGDAQVLIRLVLGQSESVLLARITRKSYVQLALQPGLKVYAQIKSVALMRAGHEV